MDRFENPTRANRAVYAELNGADNDAVDERPLSLAVDDANELIRFLGAEARQSVAIGGTAQFGEWLGWPSWLTNGTSLPSGNGLPPRLSLADDLILIANIVDNGGAPPILARLFEDFKIHGAPITVPALYNAPTLQEALNYFVRTTSFGSPFGKIDEHRNDDRFSKQVGADVRQEIKGDLIGVDLGSGFTERHQISRLFHQFVHRCRAGSRYGLKCGDHDPFHPGRVIQGLQGHPGRRPAACGNLKRFRLRRRG